MSEPKGVKNTNSYAYIHFDGSGGGNHGQVYVVPRALLKKSLATLAEMQKSRTWKNSKVRVLDGYQEAVHLTSLRHPVVIWAMTVGHKVRTHDGPATWCDVLIASEGLYNDLVIARDKKMGLYS